jgi:hypothetical protein
LHVAAVVRKATSEQRQLMLLLEQLLEDTVASKHRA